MTRWERIGETTTWGRYLADIERRTIMRAENLLGKVGKALEAGCGGGRWSKLLADRGWDLTCVDVDADALALCQRRIPTAKCVLASPRDECLPCGDAAIDLLLCIEVVPVIESAWFVRETRRVLIDGGLLVGVFINAHSLRGVASRRKEHLRGREEHARFYRASYGSFKEQLTESGFKVLDEESFCWGPFRRDSNSPFVPLWSRMERALHLNRVVMKGPWVAFIASKGVTASDSTHAAPQVSSRGAA